VNNGKAKSRQSAIVGACAQPASDFTLKRPNEIEYVKKGRTRDASCRSRHGTFKEQLSIWQTRL